MAGYGDFSIVPDTVKAALAGDGWPTGDRFTVADLHLGSHLIWGMMFGSIERRPAFEAFVSRLTGRPAYRRASALNDAAMPAGA